MSIRPKPTERPCPRSYEEMQMRGLRRGTDYLVLKGNVKLLASCMLAAPHGGKIEPMTSEIVKGVAKIGPWAWYSFEGRLQSRNWRRLHVTSTNFDEPRFLKLVTRTPFVIAVHGMDGAGLRILVGGRFTRGRAVVAKCLNAGLDRWGVKVAEVDISGHVNGIAGLARENLVNRGVRREGVQLEISRGLRELLKTEGRVLRSLCAAVHASIVELTTQESG